MKKNKMKSQLYKKNKSYERSAKINKAGSEADMKKLQQL